MAIKLPEGAFPFVCIGATGFVVDATILTTLVIDQGWNHYSARLASFSVAVTVTWLLNRNWTFSKRVALEKKREYTLYIVVQTTGSLINFGIYSLFVAISAALARYPVVPLAMATTVSMVFNFVFLRRYVFTARPPGAAS